MNDFNELLNLIGRQLAHDAVNRLKRHYTSLMPAGRPAKEQLIGRILLETLSVMGLLSPDNIQLLRHLAEESKKEELREAVLKYARTRTNIIEPCDSQLDFSSDVKGTGFVTTVVFSLSASLRRDQLDALCTSLSNSLCVKRYDVLWKGYKKEEDSNMLLVALLLPIRCLTKMFEMELNVMEVHIRKELKIVKVVVDETYHRLIKAVQEDKLQSVANDLPKEVINDVFLDAVRADNCTAIKNLMRLFHNEIDLETAIKVSVSCDSSNALEMLISEGARVHVTLLCEAYLLGLEGIVEVLKSNGPFEMVSLSDIMAVVSDLPDYPVTLFEKLLEDLSKAGEALSKQYLTNCLVNNRDDLALILIRKGVRITTDALSQFSECIGNALAKSGSRIEKERRQIAANEWEINWENFQLTFVSKPWFDEVAKLQRLTRVKLSGNQLLSIPFSLLDGTYSFLEVVDCSENKIKILENFASDRFSTMRLKILNLSNNKLESLPNFLFNIASLERLDVSSNCLSGKALPECDHDTWKCVNLAILNISHNKIDTLPESVKAIFNLRRLDASSNQLKSLPESLRDLKVLKVLDLSANQLSHWEQKESTCVRTFSDSLSRLSLKENRLTVVPKAVLSITALQKLDCSNNLINCLPPPEDWHLPNLVDLSLAKNCLQRVVFPAQFSTSLSKLDLSHNQLDYFPEAVFQLSLLYSLDLRGNKKVKEIPVRLAGLNRLEEYIIDDMKEAVKHVDPTLVERRDTVSYTTVKKTLREQFLEMDFFYGVKLTVIGKKADREEIVQRLHGTKELYKSENLKDLFVTNLVLKNTQKKEAHFEATFKVWNIEDKESFVALQQAIFTENTIHLLLPDESDGNKCFDDLEEWCSLIKPACDHKTIRILVGRRRRLPASHKTKTGFPESLDHCKIVYIDSKNRDVFSLPTYLVEEAVDIGRKQPRKTKVSFHWRKDAFSQMKTMETSTAVKKLDDFKSFLSSDEKRLEKFTEIVEELSFLSRIGALLHCRDTPRDLYNYFFPNINLVTGIISKLSRKSMRTDCLSERELHRVLKDFSLSEENLEPFVALLTKLEIIVPIANNFYLLPFCLAKDRPGLHLSFSRFSSSSQQGKDDLQCVRRLFSISQMVPSPFWGQLIARLAQDVPNLLSSFTPRGEVAQDFASLAKPHSVYWSKGIAVFYDAGCFIVEAIDNQFFNSEKHKRLSRTEFVGKNTFIDEKTGVDVTVFDSYRRFAVLGVICDHVEELLLHYNLELETNVFVPFPPFEDTKEANISDIFLSQYLSQHLFPDTKIYQMAESTCQKDDSFSPSLLKQLAPDLVVQDLADRFHLDPQKLKPSAHMQLSDLGRGGFGRVVLEQYDNEDVAVKVFESHGRLPSESRHSGFNLECGNCHRNLKNFRREVTILQRLRHRNVVIFKGVLLEPYPRIVMELARSGDLEKFIQDRIVYLKSTNPNDGKVESAFTSTLHDGLFGRRLTQRIAFQIALGLRYLHRQSICYLDLKPPNVLILSESVDDPVNVKLSDYGISCRYRPEEGVRTLAGTVGYQSPEQILCSRGSWDCYDTSVDIYSYGIVLYEIMTGEHPFAAGADSSYVFEFKILEGLLPTLPNGQSLVYLQSLIKRCWKYRPGERPDASRIVAELSKPEFQMRCKDLPLGKECSSIIMSSVVSDQKVEKFRKQITAKQVSQDFTVPLESEARKRSASTLETSFASDVLSDVNQKIWKLRSFSLHCPVAVDFGNTKSVPLEELEAPVEESSSVTIAEPELSLIATSDSFLLHNPSLSVLLSDQNVSSFLTISEMSAVLWVEEYLWVGLKTEEILVFACNNGKLVKQLQRNRCNRSVAAFGSDTIECGNSCSGIKVFAFLTNGEVMTFKGEVKNSGRVLNPWASDEKYVWEPPRYWLISDRNLIDKEAPPFAHTQLVLNATPGEMWHIQGNSLTIINSHSRVESAPSEQIKVAGAVSISCCVLLGKSVWLLDDGRKEMLTEISIESKKVSQWNLERFSVENVNPEFSISCIAAIEDTLWIGCGSGNIVVLDPKNEGKPKLICEFCCSHIPELSKFPGDSSFQIKRFQLVGDRVLVFQSVSYGEKEEAFVSVYEAWPRDRFVKEIQYGDQED